MLFNIAESQDHDDNLNMLALLTQTVEAGATRSAVGRATRAGRMEPPETTDRPDGRS